MGGLCEQGDERDHTPSQHKGRLETGCTNCKLTRTQEASKHCTICCNYRQVEHVGRPEEGNQVVENVNCDGELGLAVLLTIYTLDTLEDMLGDRGLNSIEGKTGIGVK